MGLFDEEKELIGDDYVKLVGNWIDPYPYQIERIENKFWLLNDSILPNGSKVRGIDYIIGHDPNYQHVKEWCFGSANPYGLGPAALSYVCSKYGKKSVFFMAERKEPTENQQKVLDNGGIIYWQKMGMLTVTEKRAKDYVLDKPKERMLLPIGIEHPTVLGSLIKSSRNMFKDIEFTEIWSVGSGGVLNRSLQLAFPDIPVNVVQIGHKMDERQIGRAKLYISPYKFDKPVKDEDKPPYSAQKWYDAKLWSFIRQYGKEKSLIWSM